MKKIWIAVILSALMFMFIAASPSMYIIKSDVRTSQGSIVSATNISGVTTGGWLYGILVACSGNTTTYTIDLYDHESGITVMATRIIPSIIIPSGTSNPTYSLWFDPPVSFNSGISTVVTNTGALKQYQVYYIKR